MHYADFETILQKLSGITKHLYFHVMGEPLLHPDLANLMKISDHYGFQVNITTNGVLIREQAHALTSGNALRQVNFSLHSQEHLPDESSLKNYLSDIFHFIEIAKQKGRINIALRLWNLPDEEHGLQGSFPSQYNAFIASVLQERFKPEFEIIEALKTEKRIRISEGLFLNSAEIFQWPSLEADEIGDSGFCLGLRDHIAILADGTVVPCCLDGGGIIRLGNLFEQDFHQIIHGERARNLYARFSNRQAAEELCKRCGYRTRF